MDIRIAFDEFLQYHKKIANKSNSIDNYYFQIKPFFKFVGPGFDTDDLSIELILEYNDYLHNSPNKNGKIYSQGSISSYMRTVRIFCKWLAERKGIDIYYKDIPVKKMIARESPIYTDEELLKILETCKSSIKCIGVRNKLCIILMYDSGLRQIELTRIKISDIDRVRKRIKVFGKGDKYRYAPLHTPTIEYIDLYISLCPHSISDTLLLSDDGSNLTGNAIRIMTNKIKHKLNFPFSSHILRHNFATNYLLDKYEMTKQLDIEGLRVIMGHISPSTTRIYIHIVESLIACRDAPSHFEKILKRA